MSRFQYCLRIVLKNEGGVSNHKADRGGLTNYGITQKVYSDFCRMTGRMQKPVTDILMDEVEAIYGGYWKDSKAALCPEPLDLMMFDAGVNHGPNRAVKLLQRTLGVDEDGVFGKQTALALNEDCIARGVEEVCFDYLEHRDDFFDAIVNRDPKQAVFLRGWKNRTAHLRELV